MEEDYTLYSSSSAEAGEIPGISIKRFKQNNSIPWSKSYLKYMYLPNKTIFIGPNSIPRPYQYPGTTVTTKIKKKIKQDIPYPFSICPLTEDQEFFNMGLALVENEGLNFIEDLKFFSKYENFKKFTDNNLNMMNFRSFSHIDIKQDGYFSQIEDLINDKFFSKYQFPLDKKLYILISDTILNSINDKNKYLSYKVINKDDKIIVYFTVCSTREIEYYEYLLLYGEQVIENLGSYEMRIYTGDNVVLMVYSSTVYMDNNNVKRLMPGLDVIKNITLAVSTNDVSVVDAPGDTAENEVNSLLKIKFKEGEYIYNDGKTYIISETGKKIQFIGVTYNDLIED